MNEKNSKRNDIGVDYSGFTVASIVNNHTVASIVNNHLEQGEDTLRGKSDSSSQDFSIEADTDETKAEPVASHTDDRDVLDLDDEMIEAHERKASRENDDDKVAEEELFASDDFVLSEDEDAAVIKQLEGTVSWYIDGLYNDNGKTHNSIYLRENPPLFIIESSDGDEASFILTKDLARTFAKTFGDLNKVYYGSRKERGEKSFDEKVKAMPEWSRENPIKAVVGLALVFALFVFLVVSAF